MSPFVQSFVEKLDNIGISSTIFDTEEMRLIQKKQTIWNCKLFRLLLKIRFPANNSILKSYIILLCFKFHKFRFDSISIWYLQPILFRSADIIRKSCKQMNIFYSGSDYYRSKTKNKIKAIPILKITDNIVLSSPRHKNDFNLFYNGFFDSKIKYLNMWVDGFENIHSIEKNNSIGSLKEKYSIPIDKIIVSIGYNGIREQQHIKIIRELKINPESIFVIIPATYGLTNEYKKEIELELEKIQINFIILDNYLTADEIAEIRLIPDIVLNFQTSDAASRSILESVYANKILLLGNWLPYDFLDSAGIIYYKSPFSQLNTTLLSIINDINEIKLNCTTNKPKIEKDWAIDAILPKWERFFQNKFD